MDDRPVVTEKAATTIVTLPTEIDITNSDQVGADLQHACQSAANAVIADLTRTTFCDSSAVRALLEAHKLATSRGIELDLVVTSAAVLRVLELTGLDRTLRLYPSIDAVVTASRQSHRDTA